MVVIQCMDVKVNLLRRYRNFNGIKFHCVIYRETPSSTILPIGMKDKLATIIGAFNYDNASAVNTKLFTKLCKKMDSNHKTLLFYTSV